jgi:hypothetical protein
VAEELAPWWLCLALERIAIALALVAQRARLLAVARAAWVLAVGAGAPWTERAVIRARSDAR